MGIALYMDHNVARAVTAGLRLHRRRPRLREELEGGGRAAGLFMDGNLS